MKSIRQGFGFGCGCLLLIIVVVIGGPILGLGALVSHFEAPASTLRIIRTTPRPTTPALVLATPRTTPQPRQVAPKPTRKR